MHSKLAKAIGLIDFAVAYIAAVCLIGVTILGIVMRYMFSSPLTWLEEVQMMCIVWLVTFGGSAAFRLNHHVAIDALAILLPAPIQKFLEYVVAMLVLLALGFLAYAGSMFVAFQFGANRITEVLGIPYGMIYLAIPLGSILMLLAYFTTSVVPLLCNVQPDE